MITIKGLLTPEELDAITARLAAASFVDGGETATGRAKAVKHNLQLPYGGDAERELDAIVRQAFQRNDQLQATAMPRHVLPFRFSRYEAGMTYGWHTDAPVMMAPGQPIRTDLACTLFLVPPTSYEGGELTVQTAVGHLTTKLQAGDALVYPATSVHRVEPVRSGVRLVAVTWIQSMIASAEQRQLLIDLFRAIKGVEPQLTGSPEMEAFNAVHGNLVRMWSQP